MTELVSIIAPDEYIAERVLLRSYRPGDGTELNAATIESFEHLQPWMPWATETQTEEEAEQLVRTFRGRYLLSQEFVLAIRTPDDRRLIGGAGYHLREGPLALQSAEMGMWIRASEAGKGFGTAALEAMVTWGFTEWPWLRLSWRCDAKNAASGRIAEKAGLKEEGRLRKFLRAPSGEMQDASCYAILRVDWFPAE